MKRVLILDFGGQYNLLIARRVRECGVYCEIKSFRISPDEIRAFAPDALIFTGGPATVFDEGAPMVDPALFSMGIPVLGICYGMQLMTHLLGGQCRRAVTREYGKTELHHTGTSRLFAGVPETAVYWMSHGVEVEKLAPDFCITASSQGCRHAAIECEERRLYGVQFHPEVMHTEYGTQILENFLYGICGFSREWTMSSYVDTAIAECREKIGEIALHNGKNILMVAPEVHGHKGVRLQRCAVPGSGGVAYAAVGHAAVKAGDDDPAPRRKPLEIFVGALLVDRSVEGKMQPILCIEEIIAEVIGHEHRREIFAARDELILGYAGFYLPAQGGELRVDIDLEPQLGADLAIAPGDHVENWVAADAVLFVRMAEIQKVCQLVIVLEPLTRGGNDDHLSRRVCFDN